MPLDLLLKKINNPTHLKEFPPPPDGPHPADNDAGREELQQAHYQSLAAARQSSDDDRPHSCCSSRSSSVRESRLLVVDGIGIDRSTNAKKHLALLRGNGASVFGTSSVNALHNSEYSTGPSIVPVE